LIFSLKKYKFRNRFKKYTEKNVSILKHLVFNTTINVYLPMNQNVSASKTGGMNEVVAQRKILRQVLIRTVGSQDA